MISHESGNSSAAGSGVHLDFPFAKAPDRPAVSGGSLIKSSVPFSSFETIMPVIPVGLNDQPCLLEHEIGLEPAEHCLVHLEVKTPLPELVMQKALDGGVFGGERVTQSGLAHSLTYFRRVLMTKMTLPHLLSDFGPQLRLANLLSVFKRKRLASMGLADFLSCFCRLCLTQATLAELLSSRRSNQMSLSVYHTGSIIAQNIELRKL